MYRQCSVVQDSWTKAGIAVEANLSPILSIFAQHWCFVYSQSLLGLKQCDKKHLKKYQNYFRVTFVNVNNKSRE